MRANESGSEPGLGGAVLSFEHLRDFIQSRRTMEDRTMKTYTVTYNVTLTIEVQADSTDEAERLADRELPSHCDVNCAVVCHRIATSPARTHEDN
jgi:hypothetical protein